MAPSERYLLLISLRNSRLHCVWRQRQGWFKEHDATLQDIRPLSTNDN